MNIFSLSYVGKQLSDHIRQLCMDLAPHALALEEAFGMDEHACAMYM